MLFARSIEIHTMRMHIKKQPGPDQEQELVPPNPATPAKVTKGSSWEFTEAG